MTTLVGLGVLALSLLVVFQGFVLVEMVGQVSQIRRRLDLDDLPVPIGSGLSGKPLPALAQDAWSRNGGPTDGAFLLLSVDCSTCRLVASELRAVTDRVEHRRVVPVLQAREQDEAREMLLETGLDPDETIVDLDGEYGAAFGIDIRPAAVLVRDDAVGEAAAVRNAGQLRRFLEQLDAPRKEASPV
jgi:hypothetical protein